MRRVAYTYCFTLIRSFIIYLFSETENARALSCLWPRTLNICNRYDAPSTSRWLLFFFFSFLLFFRFSPLVSPLLSILRDGFVLFLHLLLIRSRSSYRYFFSLFHVFAACTNRRVFLFNDLQIDSLLNLSNIVMYYLSRYREVVCAVNQFSFFFWYSKNESSKEFATVTFRIFLDCLILCCIRLSNSRVVDRTIERTTINKIAK